MLFKHYRLSRRQAGFTIPELLITLALMALGSIMGFSILLKKDDQEQRSRIVSDYIQHITSACQIVKSKYGTGPLKATYFDDSSTDCAGVPCNCLRYKYTDDAATIISPSTDLCDLDPDLDKNSPNHSLIPLTYTSSDDWRGMDQFLPDFESGTVASTGPSLLIYPGELYLYTRPDEATIADTSNQIPNHNNHTPAPASNFKHDDIMKTVDDREWLLIDMNGTDAPNSIAAGGDRVLIHVNNETCKVMTAKQKCDEVEATTAGYCDGAGETAFGQSFYDVFMNY